MASRLRRLRRLRPTLAIAAVAIWLAGSIGAAPVAAAATGVTRDLYFPAAWVHQIDARTCTAASVVIMMKIIAGPVKALTPALDLDQMAILHYEQPRDALDDAVQRGSDPLGWAGAATGFSRVTGRATGYVWRSFPTASAALRAAAVQIAVTGKPVGLLVQHGKHAMVMTGFVASADPATTPTFALTSVVVSDPNGLPHAKYPATSSPLNAYLETDATDYYDAAWYGRYVVILPVN